MNIHYLFYSWISYYHSNNIYFSYLPHQLPLSRPQVCKFVRTSPWSTNAIGGFLLACDQQNAEDSSEDAGQITDKRHWSTHTLSPYIPYNNSPLEKNSATEPEIEPWISWLVGNDITMSPAAGYTQYSDNKIISSYYKFECSGESFV